MSYSPPPGGAAPTDAPYLTITADATLSSEALLSVVIGRGIVASRPAFGTAGRLYFATDDNVLYRDTGSAWESVEGSVSAAHDILSASHSDVDAGATPVDGDVLTWDGDQWVPAQPPNATTPAATTLSFVTTAAEGSLSNETVLGTGAIVAAAHASLPAAALAGRLALPSDGFTVERDTGSAYEVWGPVFPFTPPVNGDFSWVNQGGASVVESRGGIYLAGPASASQSFRLREKAAPSTPYVVTAAFVPLNIGGSLNQAGIFFRENATGELVIFGVQSRTDNESGWRLHVHKWTSPTAFSATYVSLNAPWMGNVVFLRIADNGTDRICSWSVDGQNWLVIHTVGRTDFLTADRVGFYVDSFSATYSVGMTLLSWNQT